MGINVAGEDVRYFHTRKSGVDRIWIDRYAPHTAPASDERACAAEIKVHDLAPQAPSLEGVDSSP